MPGINRSKSRARGQKRCPWGCAGLWRGLWGRSQRLFSSPGRYLAAEGAVLNKTNGPTSAGLALPGHRQNGKEAAPKRPPSWDTGRGSLPPAALHVPCVRWVFRWTDFGCLPQRSWLEPKMAYTHLLTQRKSPLLPSLAPLGAMWRLVGRAWAPGGLCPTPPYQLHARPSRPLASHPLKSPHMPFVSPGRPSQLIFGSKGRRRGRRRGPVPSSRRRRRLCSSR